MKENVIVIGAGIGGLSCAALLSHGGYRVTVLEKNSYIGGACSSYEKQGYTLDRSVHLFSLGLNGPFGEILNRLGLKNLEFVKGINKSTAMKFYQTEGYYPSDFNVNSMINAMKPSTSEGESTGKETENAVMRRLKKIGVNTQTFKDLGKVMASILTMRKKKLAQLYEDGLTVTEYISQFTEDAFIHGLFAFILAGMFAISPKQASAGEFVHCFKTEMTTREGYQYPLGGGSQAVPNALAEGIRKYGGKLQTNSHVDSIAIKNDKVQGVMVNNEMIKAPIVISNLSIRMTLLNLVGRDYFERNYLAKIESLKPSLSSMTFKLALKEPLIKDWGCVNLYHPTLDDWKGKYGPGAPKSNGFFGPIPSNIDPSLAPKGGQVAIFGTIVPAKVSNWDKWQEVYYADLQEFFPEIEKKLNFLDVSFPKDFTKATGKPFGPVEGLALTPNQTGKNKPSSVVPIEGLYVVGDTAGTNAHGIGTQLAADSGIKCADMILGKIEKR
ncbi:MAG: phytoene desaturase family protein [Promethearchaeota archaeon]